MDWREKLEKSLAQGIDQSKSLLGKASDRARELGEQGVLSLEVRQLEGKIKENYRKLGEQVYQVLKEGQQSTVSARTSGVKDLLDELEAAKELLEEKRAALHTEDPKKSHGTG